MHNKLFKMLLTAVMVALPTLSIAADATSIPSAAPKATLPEQAAPSTPQVVAIESKPVASATVRQSTRIGYVDIVRIGAESDKGKALKALLEAKKNQLQGKIDGKKKQIEKLKASIESKIATMTPPQREAKSKEFQKKLDEYQKFVRTAEEEFITLQEKETRSLFEDIEKSSVAHGTANGFAVIVIKKELLYVGNSVDAQDLTETLIKAMNEAGQNK
jgi:outer membrane protein